MSGIHSNVLNLYKEAYQGHPYQVWVLSILTFVNRIGTMVMPFLTIYLTTILGFTLKEAGFLTGAYGIGAMLGAYISGKLSDKYGSQPIIFISLLVAGIVMISLQWNTSFAALFVFLIVAGTFAEAYRPAVMSNMGNLVKPSETGRTMSLMRLAISLGMSLAPTIGGIAAVTLGYSWLFWIDGLTCITAAFFYWIFSRPETKSQATHTPTALPASDAKPIPPYKNRSYLIFLLATFLAGFSFMQWFGTVPVFIKSEWNFDERYIGLMMGISSIIIALFEMPIVHHLEKNRKVFVSSLIGVLLIGLSFVPFFFDESLAMYACAMVIWTFGTMLFFSFNNAVPLKLGSAGNKGDYMGWYWMVWSLCGILGPSMGMFAIELVGYTILWLVLLCMITFSLVVHLFLSNKIT